MHYRLLVKDFTTFYSYYPLSVLKELNPRRRVYVEITKTSRVELNSRTPRVLT
jgi:hypothetical protein